ncbi:cell adhesion molecule 4-like [Anneissia japonica]|uniref:cell adhesion molecule 4-like n=1 Tax=Anneissia japonica TaxID=1529436 RepID=UPI00142583B0|nr:cell adhesion molecule 4-like [Anneissia japonica]
MAIALLFLLCCLEIAGAQNISVNPSTVEVLEGGDVTLTCEVTNYKESYILHWNRIDGNVTGDRAMEIFTTDGKVRLEINSAQIEDAGTYFCTMYDKELKTVQLSLASKVTVLFHVLDMYPLCAFSQYLGQLQVGTPVVLRCQYPSRDLKNVTSLVWEKGNQEKVKGKQWQYLDEQKKMVFSFLNFTATEDLHDETFTCTYHNQSIRHQHQVCHIGPIGVHYAPKVKVYPGEVSIDAGDVQIQFNCSGPAQPNLVSYVWHIIPQTEGIKTREINNGKSLILTDISQELSGHDFEIKCAAINKVGVTNVQAVLHIKPEHTDNESSFTSSIIFPVAIAVAAVCFIFLIIFTSCFLLSRREKKNVQEHFPNNTLEFNNPGSAYATPVQRAEANPYATVDAAGLVVNLPDPEQDGAYAKAEEFEKDIVELIKE